MSSLFVFYVRVRLLHKNYTVILPEIHIIIPGGDDVGLLEGGGLLPDERVLDGLHRHAGRLPPGLQVLTRTYTTGAGYSIRKTAGQIPKKDRQETSERVYKKSKSFNTSETRKK